MAANADVGPILKRLLLTLVLAAVVSLAGPGMALGQAAPGFKLGFKALADQILDVVGQPLENEHWGPNGDSLQQTTTGLMVWRKVDNWTAFTDGSSTWINGPFGVASRPNSQRFEWEQQAPSPTPVAASSRGLILYQADWSSGAGGWALTSGWSAVSGVLASDGSGDGLVIPAPYTPAVPNYAVEAQIQVVRMGIYNLFGVMARGGYLGGVESINYAAARHSFIGTTGQPGQRLRAC